MADKNTTLHELEKQTEQRKKFRKKLINIFRLIVLVGILLIAYRYFNPFSDNENEGIKNVINENAIKENIKLLQTGEPIEAITAGENLLRIGAPSGKYLVNVLKSPTPQIRALTAYLLGELKDSTAFLILNRMVADNDEHPIVRDQAMFAILKTYKNYRDDFEKRLSESTNDEEILEYSKSLSATQLEEYKPLIYKKIKQIQDDEMKRFIEVEVRTNYSLTPPYKMRYIFDRYEQIELLQNRQ